MYHTVRTTPPASYSLLHQSFVSSHSHSLLIPSIILFLLFIPYYTIIRNQSPPRPPDLLAAVNSTALLVFVSCGSRSLLDFVLYSTGYSLSLSLSLPQPQPQPHPLDLVHSPLCSPHNLVGFLFFSLSAPIIAHSPAKTSSLGSDFLRFFGAGSYNQQPPPPDDPNRITRDGHPAKRRGPKPNSKPAMTRRQELNRQAQRSHRERKEQYIRTMETEVSRLREAYTQEISAANVTVQQHRHMVYSLTEENDILKEILSAHGISYESELESRKSHRPGPGYHQSSPFNSSMGSSTLPTLPPSSHGQNNAYTTPPTTVSSNMSPRNGAPSDLSPKSEPSHAGHSHGSHGHAHHQCEPMGFMDRSGGMVNGPAVQDMGGIFETDPQLQIDFILTYVLISGPFFNACTDNVVWNHHVANIPITSVDDPSSKQTTKTCPSPATR